jgi:hypothetical protein
MSTFPSYFAIRDPVFERRYDDGEVRFAFGVDEGFMSEIIVIGRGNMPGSRSMLEYLDEAVKRFGVDRASRLFFDLSQVNGGPLRAQIMFGRWLLKHRKIVHRAAVFGAGPWERRLATVACKIAGFKGFRFFTDATTARIWMLEDETPAAAPPDDAVRRAR